MKNLIKHENEEKHEEKHEVRYEERHEEIPEQHSDVVIQYSHLAIRVAVRLLAVLMVLVIYWSIADVVYVLYEHLMAAPIGLLDLNDILNVFGAFMVVLIGIEIFINIRIYLGTNAVPVKLVLATALMAVARKIIVLDLSIVSAEKIVGLALVTIALGVSYWLTTKRS